MHPWTVAAAGGTYALMKGFLPTKAGIHTTFVDISDLQAVAAAITPRTKVGALVVSASVWLRWHGPGHSCWKCLSPGNCHAMSRAPYEGELLLYVGTWKGQGGDATDAAESRSLELSSLTSDVPYIL
jgi:hypothetical protein